MTSAPLNNIHGRRLQLGTKNNLYSNDIPVTTEFCDATVVVGDESADVRAITITLKNSLGEAIDFVREVEIVLFTTAARVAYVATGGSTGIAIGANGVLQAIVTKKRFMASSDINGVITLTWTDTGTEAAAIGVKMPNGRFVMGSQLLTNA